MLETLRHGDILELRLARPPVNALDPALVAELRHAIETAPAQHARALLLSGRPGMFSAGLDVPALLELDRAGMRAFWHDFFSLCGALAASTIPVAAAITGHSPAGGAVLAIFCDYRVMAQGPCKIGLNEVQVGLTVPEVIQYGLRRLVGTHRAERLLVAGAMIDSGEALRIGLVDALAPADEVVAHAHAWLAELLQLPAQSMRETRRIARADLAAVFADPSKFAIDAFVEAWFSAESQITLKALVAKLKSR
jgi:enoyl-CoA hydratase/carnithine racemase